MHRQTWLLGSGRQMQRAQTGLDQRYRRVPERRRYLHRMHHARLPGQVHALHGRAAWRQGFHHRIGPVRLGNPQPARASPTARSTRNRAGDTRATNSPQGRTAPGRPGHDFSQRQEANFDDNDHPRAVPREAGARPIRGDGLGSDHPDRRQPRHLHQDRLREPRSRRVPQHVVDLPRLLDLHERQGSARRALHHQPHLRHLR